MADLGGRAAQDCEVLGGTASDRPSATDSDKTIATCSGGDMGGNACIYTATTTDCMPVREKPTEGVPNLIDVTDLRRTTTAAPGVDSTTTADASPSVAAPDDGG